MNAIKESFDNLPAAICIFSSKGLVRLMNRRMLAVGAMLLGSGIQTLGELQAVLKNPPETVTKDAAMPGVYHFPDGSALRFSAHEITDRDGQRYTEVIAADVSELMEVQTENRENGLSAAAQIKIVIVTSLLDAEVLRQAKLLGTDSLWYKDGSHEKLMEIVRRTLSGEHFFPDAPPVTQIGMAKSSEFTEAEMRVLRCLVQGMSYTATAQTLGVDARTVKFHVSNMLQKTNFENKLQLAVAAIENRLTANFPEE